MPHLSNCSHSGDGHCLTCVAKTYALHHAELAKVALTQDVSVAALRGLIANQVVIWKLSNFTDEQIRAMPYLKPAFDAVALAIS
jgi:hypothetical protein